MNKTKNVPEANKKTFKSVKLLDDVPIWMVAKYCPGIEPHIKNEPYIRRIKIEEIKNK